MNRTTRLIAVLAVALLAATVASFVVYRALAAGSAPQQPHTIDTLVAARAIPSGTMLTRDHVKVVQWPADPVTEPESRTRVCDIGGLRTPYVRPDGKLGYRCPAEPVAAYVEKGGRIEDTVGRRCLCNALTANVGHAQVRADGAVVPPLLTSGDDLATIGGFLAGRTRYSVDDVLEYLLAEVTALP